MQQLDNDMDDLFRRAAEGYPLKPGKSQWREIESEIMAASASGDNKKNKSRLRKFLLPFLLLFSLLVAVVFFMLIIAPGHQKSVKKIIPSESLVSAKNKQEATKGALSNNNSENPKKPQNFITHIGPVKSMQKKDLQRTPENFKNFYPSSGVSSLTTHDNVNGSKDNSRLTGYATPGINPGTQFIAHLVTSSLIEQTHILFMNKTNSKAAARLRMNRFSFSVVGAAELNKVSAMPYMAGGFNAGLLGAYDFNSKFFLETGILLGKKQYHSSGHDFSLRKIGDNMPGGMVINDLEGLSNILEFPVHAGFRIRNIQNGNIYFSGGTSAYLVTKENNHYNVTMNGAAEKMEGTYKKNIFLIPATINVSAGVEKELHPKISLRGELYFRLPVNGIGVGELPVTSAGVQLGLKKRFR